MDEKQAKILKRVLKKLSAMRATLTKPEQAVLDALLIDQPDVQGHAMQGAVVAAKPKKMRAARLAAAAEVEGHAMTAAAGSGPLGAARGAAQGAVQSAAQGAAVGAIQLVDGKYSVVDIRGF